MMNQDKKMIAGCIDNADELFANGKFEHPMDADIIRILKGLKEKIRDDDDDYILFKYREEIDKLWGMLLEKAIKCLRYYDLREPFLKSGDNKKKPRAYGLDDLKKYYEKYTEFERVLYGSSRYYRDHVIHVLRTWLSGINLLVKNNGAVLDNITIHDKIINISLTREEKISIWTMIALTHDLGYPLQKAKSIIDVTQDMLSSFIANPDISVDFAFHGVQNYMNDYVVRLMSSKMEKRKLPEHLKNIKTNKQPESEEEKKETSRYVTRLQSKYYFKFQKSLEKNSHGILSTLILYKLLTYFLESDYNINEDYYFNEEECRQFYIRREILRAIASHTCDDIYQMYMGSFSFLLRICDDTQEWGRKNISELYVNSDQKYELQDIEMTFGEEKNQCTIEEEMTVQDEESVIMLISRLYEQALDYVTIFRDGQDTVNRDFSFKRELTIKTNYIPLVFCLTIDKNQASQLNGTIRFKSDGSKNSSYGKKFKEMLAKNTSENITYEIDGELIDDLKNGEGEASKWKEGKLVISLID